MAETWRENLELGDAVDVRDSEGRWFDSVVVEVEEPPGTQGQDPFQRMVDALGLVG